VSGSPIPYAFLNTISTGSKTDRAWCPVVRTDHKDRRKIVGLLSIHVRWNYMQLDDNEFTPTTSYNTSHSHLAKQPIRNSESIPPSGSYLHKPALSVPTRHSTFDISLHIPTTHHQIKQTLHDPLHNSTTPNPQLKPSALIGRIPTDFNPRRAELAKPLVAQIRLAVSAARTVPLGSAAWQAVEVWEARWAAWLGGGEVGAC
jgi:hypothetical protein